MWEKRLKDEGKKNVDEEKLGRKRSRQGSIQECKAGARSDGDRELERRGSAWMTETGLIVLHVMCSGRT